MRINQSNPALPLVQRGRPIGVHVNGRLVTAFEGESVAALLLAEGVHAFRQTARTGERRGIFCGMGICFDCLVTVDGRPNIRACITPVVEGMTIETRGEVTL